MLIGISFTKTGLLNEDAFGFVEFRTKNGARRVSRVNRSRKTSHLEGSCVESTNDEPYRSYSQPAFAQTYLHIVLFCIGCWWPWFGAFLDCFRASSGSWSSEWVLMMATGEWLFSTATTIQLWLWEGIIFEQFPCYKVDIKSCHLLLKVFSKQFLK